MDIETKKDSGGQQRRIEKKTTCPILTAPLKPRCRDKVGIFGFCSTGNSQTLDYWLPTTDQWLQSSQKRLLWMRHISVWDDVPHYSTFNNLDVVELAASKHNEAAILQYTSSHLDNMSTVNRIYHRQHFLSFNGISPQRRRQSQSRRMQKHNSEASHGHRRRVNW